MKKYVVYSCNKWADVPDLDSSWKKVNSFNTYEEAEAVQFYIMRTYYALTVKIIEVEI